MQIAMASWLAKKEKKQFSRYLGRAVVCKKPFRLRSHKQEFSTKVSTGHINSLTEKIELAFFGTL